VQVIRALTDADGAQVLALNRAARPNVAPLDSAELARLQTPSNGHVVIVEDGAVLGYALVFPDDAAYDGEEFRVLRTRVPRPFTYVDQVAVHPPAHRMGIGRRLYRHVEQAALARGATCLCCEVNLAPPNPASSAFHERLGFRSVGRLSTTDGREVDLLAKRLSGAA
jgi:predicted GNAT superfamily acetyltransferase